MPHCKRCEREFTPKKEGQEYGPVCARKLAGQVQLDGQAFVSGKVLRKKKASEKAGVCRVCGCTDLMPCPGSCSWVEPDLCSTCAEKKARNVRLPDGTIEIYDAKGVRTAVIV